MQGYYIYFCAVSPVLTNDILKWPCKIFVTFMHIGKKGLILYFYKLIKCPPPNRDCIAIGVTFIQSDFL